MKWKDKLIKDLLKAVANDPEWSVILEEAIYAEKVSIHLAIFNEPFLTMMFNREKTIESRFSVNNVTPFSQIQAGDVIIIKRSGGDVEGLFLAEDVFFLSNLTKERLLQIEKDYGRQIGWQADPEFFKSKNDANYLSMIFIGKIKRVVAEADKRDRTAWSVLRYGLRNTLFDNKM